MSSQFHGEADALNITNQSARLPACSGRQRALRGRGTAGSAIPNASVYFGGSGSYNITFCKSSKGISIYETNILARLQLLQTNGLKVAPSLHSAANSLSEWPLASALYPNTDIDRNLGRRESFPSCLIRHAIEKFHSMKEDGTTMPNNIG